MMCELWLWCVHTGGFSFFFLGVSENCTFLFVCMHAEKILEQTARHFTKAKETVCATAPHRINPAQPTLFCYILEKEKKNDVFTFIHADLFRVQSQLLYYLISFLILLLCYLFTFHFEVISYQYPQGSPQGWVGPSRSQAIPVSLLHFALPAT